MYIRLAICLYIETYLLITQPNATPSNQMLCQVASYITKGK